MGHLIQSNRKSSTIRSYKSAIKTVPRDDGEVLNANSYLLKSLTRACKIKNDQVKILLPIAKRVLKLLLSALVTMYESQPYLLTMYCRGAMNNDALDAFGVDVVY